MQLCCFGVGQNPDRAVVVNARMRYSESHPSIQVFLLDDPLSAVDVHVAGALFNKVVCGYLRNSARVLVLNSHYHLLRHADRIVVMEKGAIAAQGAVATPKRPSVNNSDNCLL